MAKQAQNVRKQFGLLGVICGSLLLSLPAIAMPQMETEKLVSQINPSPSIFQEAPYNRSRTTAPAPSQPSTPTIQPPPPEEQQAPSATIPPVEGQVSVKLVNKTGANISYQVIGDTNQRSLQGKSEVMLTGLSVPVTVTFRRDDSGLLNATAQPSSEPGMLEVILIETTDLGIDSSTMRIQNTGAVFFY